MKQTSIVALDAEMLICVGEEKQIGRLSIVNYNRVTLYDSFFKPSKRVKSYLTEFSGLTALNTSRAPTFEDEKAKIAEILKGKTIVGHSLGMDRKVLTLEWESKMQRDISNFPIFKKNSRKVKLKTLSEKFLRLEIQHGRHSSVEDARAALELYKLYRKEIDSYSKDLYFFEKEKEIKKGSIPKLEKVVEKESVPTVDEE